MRYYLDVTICDIQLNHLTRSPFAISLSISARSFLKSMGPPLCFTEPFKSRIFLFGKEL